MPVGLSAPSELAAVHGVRLCAASAGIYRRQRPDLCLLALDPGVTAAARFTRNAFCAAPVLVARSHLARRAPRFCLINAGNANAGTGERGLQDALATCRAVAELGRCAPEEVLPFSTGVIGEHLPVQAIRDALPPMFERLEPGAWLDAARAIMTTDTLAKGVSLHVAPAGVPVTLTGIAKGAGMIHPRLATLLAFIAVDAAVEPAHLDDMLAAAVSASFNRISVDGDTSTNDAILLLATGKRAAPARGPDRAVFLEGVAAAVSEACRRLAQAVVRDGEGATKFITIRVEEGRDEDECQQVAASVARSPLIKTAFFASDPNWGRIVAAVGNAGLDDLEVPRVRVYLDDVLIVEGGGRAREYTESAGRAVMAQPEIRVRICLGRGSASLTYWTCDLSHDYVRINAEYRT